MQDSMPQSPLGYSEYADTLAKAVPAYFDLLRVAEEHHMLIATMESDEDLEIELGVTIQRLKRDDVSDEEKQKRVRAAGKWVRMASRVMAEDIIRQIMHPPSGATYDPAFLQELLPRMMEDAKLYQAAAAQNDRFEQQWSRLYPDWRVISAQRAAYFPDYIEAIQKADRRLERYVADHADAPGMTDALALREMFATLTAALKTVQEATSLQRDSNPEEFDRANHFIINAESSRAKLKMSFDYLDDGWKRAVPDPSPMVARIYEDFRRDHQQALDKAYPIDPIVR